MTLDEAIQHCYDVANKGCDECAKDHLQLAKWLEELKTYRYIKGLEWKQIDDKMGINKNESMYLHRKAKNIIFKKT